VQVQPPLITSSDCEGAGETFTVSSREASTSTAKTKVPTSKPEHFFRAPKYLTVSSQLHLEAYAAELGRVWTLSPTFRAEKSDTPRHLSEFYMLEAEVNFMDNLHSLMDLVEGLIRDLTTNLRATQIGQEILSAKRSGEPGLDELNSELSKRWEVLIDTPTWPRVTYTRAIELLQEAVTAQGAKFKNRPSWSHGLQLEHEKFLVENIFEGVPVFVTDYPKAVKPFYMAPSQSDTEGNELSTPGATVACFDLLMPVISEVVGGSLREHRLPDLLNNMREHGLIKTQLTDTSEPSPSSRASRGHYNLQAGEDLGALQWYAELRRWGTAPHGGFGLGFDRFLSYLAGVSSIRDVVPFPRHFGRADC
jgi:asparaginyl-tRNA synthetase